MTGAEYIGDRLKSEIKARKMTQSEFAACIGIDETLLSKWVNGKSVPSVDRLTKLCESISEAFKIPFTFADLMQDDSRSRYPYDCKPENNIMKFADKFASLAASEYVARTEVGYITENEEGELPCITIKMKRNAMEALPLLDSIGCFSNVYHMQKSVREKYPQMVRDLIGENGEKLYKSNTEEKGDTHG